MSLKSVSPWFSIISDLFINLSAGWFGAAFILPAVSENLLTVDFRLLTADVILGILSLILARVFRK
ncbi:MAG: hypothetical protein AAB778_01270 [Patescibacteria group bacterium]